MEPEAYIPANGSVEPIIVARSLKKIYVTANVKTRALNGIDLAVLPGEICAIPGASGSGKKSC